MNFRTRKTVVFFVCALLGLSLCEARAGLFIYDFKEFAQVPILDQGRVKPLDTFARSQLEGFYGRERLKEITAIEWLAELLFDPSRAYKRPVFNIPNPKIVDALELPRSTKHKYSYDDVSAAVSSHFATWHTLFMKQESELTMDQKQLLILYRKLQAYRDISRSLSMLFKDFTVPAGRAAEELGVPGGTQLNYVEIRIKDRLIEQWARQINQRIEDKSGPVAAQDIQVLNLAKQFNALDQDKSNQTLRVIPPQWDSQKGTWFSPWGISIEGYGSPNSIRVLRQWQDLMEAYTAVDNDAWNKTAGEIRRTSLELAGSSVSKFRLSLEYAFNTFKPFTKSLAFYLAAFLFFLCGFLFWPRVLQRLSLGFLLAGFVLHFCGVAARMYIMQRPPVTNLYASIVFVGLICVLFGLILEWRKRNGIGILIASIAGTVLQFLGLRYDADGDTMGMLQAVLDTNFWLSTHVVCITIGYGCSLVAGVLGHVYLLQRILKPSDRSKLTELYQNLKGAAIVALFFTSLGTILGGIWADQSWGRFWGWDPKENGALLIVLWLVFLIHGRLAGKLGELGFATGMVGTNVVVTLAWFGVNLLNVGLHSYGFTENAAFNLGLFCAVEILFAFGCYMAVKFGKGASVR